MNQRTVGYPSTSWASCILMTSCGTETETNGESWTIRLLLQPSVSGTAVSLLVSGLTVDILSTFCGVLMLQCVMLMLRIFEFGVLLFDCFVHRQNVTCLKRFYQVWASRRWGGRRNHRQTRSCLFSRCGKIAAFSCSVMTRFDDV